MHCTNRQQFLHVQGADAQVDRAQDAILFGARGHWQNYPVSVQPGQSGLQTTPSGTHGGGSGSSTDGPGAAMVQVATSSQSLPTTSKPSVLIEIIDSDDDVRMESENQESLEAAVACELDKLD